MLEFNKPVIAAVKGEEMLKKACSSNADIIFDLLPNIETIDKNVKLCAESNKLLFIHIDFAEGIGKDRAGLKYVKRAGVSGIISTRASMIKAAREMGLKSVQRIFIIDSQSIESAEAILKIKPDMVEIMPGILPGIIEELCSVLDIPIIAGGLLRSRGDVSASISAGADAVSTSMPELWNYDWSNL